MFAIRSCRRALVHAVKKPDRLGKRVLLSESPARNLADAWANPRAYGTNIARGALWTALGNGIVFLVWLPVTAIQVRLMSRTAFGDFAVAFSACLLLTPVVGVGLNAAVAKWFATLSLEHGMPGIAAVTKLAFRVTKWATCAAVLSGLVMLAVMLAIRTLRPDAPVFAVLLPVVASVPAAQTGNGLVQASVRPRVGFLSNLLTSFLLLVLTAALLVAGIRSPVAMASARSTAVLVGVVALVVGSRWRSLAKMPSDVRIDVRPFLAFGGAVTLWAVLNMTISQMDVLLLGAFKGSSIAGNYAPASRVADLVISLAAIVGAYLPPAIASSLAKGDRRSAATLNYWVSRWAIALSAPVIGWLILTPATLLSVLFGNRAVIVGPARVLGLAVLFDVMLGFNGAVLASSGATRALAWNAVLGFVVNIVVCLVAIPRLGAMGAAVATAVPLLSVNIGASVLVARRLRILPWDREVAVCVASLVFGGAIAAILVHFLVLAPLARLALTALLTGAPPLVIAKRGRLRDQAVVEST